MARFCSELAGEAVSEGDCVLNAVRALRLFRKYAKNHFAGGNHTFINRDGQPRDSEYRHHYRVVEAADGEPQSPDPEGQKCDEEYCCKNSVHFPSLSHFLGPREEWRKPRIASLIFSDRSDRTM